MDINARTLILKPERRTAKKARTLSAFIFITTFIVGAGLVIYGVTDVIRNNKDSGSNPAHAIANVQNPDVQGASATCRDFEENSDGLIESAIASRKWILIGHEFGDETKSLGYQVTFAKDPLQLAGFSTDIKYRIVGTGVEGQLTSDPANPLSYSANIDLLRFSPGAYKVEAVVDTPCGAVSSKSSSFNVSYPVYVLWSMDWEGYEVSDAKLNAMTSVSERHHNIPMTHFFNPRYLLPGAISEEEKSKYLDYVLKNRDLQGHSIGLHIHAYPELMTAAGVTPHNSPRWGWSSNDGYDVLVSGYSYDDLNKVLALSDSLFRQNGLGSPNMFRAGGWWIEEEGLKALEDSNYLLDSSGRKKYTLGTNGYEGPWELSSTTMPYRPNYGDQNSSLGTESEIMKLWEFPNNGADSTAHTADQLYANFRDNYSGVPVKEHRVVTYLSHPDYFHIDQPRMDELLTNIDRHLYSEDDGPVIYSTIENVFNIYITN